MIRHGDWEEGISADLAMLPAPLFDPHGVTLDLGCGLGRLSVAYAVKHDALVVGVDVSPSMIVRAEARPAWVNDARVHYRLGDGRSLPTLPSLAGAFSVLMFQHIPASAQASYVRQVAERLRPGARFTFQTVVGADDCFLSHQVKLFDPSIWCADAGLIVERSEEAVWPQWLWTTARKPE